MSLHPGGVIAWLIVGLIAGWLAGKVMRGHGYGIIGDIVVGLIGAFIEGFLFSFFFAGAKPSKGRPHHSSLMIRRVKTILAPGFSVWRTICSM
jgi:uncharacterized membrane protein YeaQ/YmgE (transglycosylase-associated protein family)